MLNLIETLSDVSRTNQLKIIIPPEEIAEKLFLYLYKLGRGIEYFRWVAQDGYPKHDKESQDTYFRERHKAIKLEIQKRIAEHGEIQDITNIQYFLSRSNGANYVFFLSPYKAHSGWKQLFCEKWGSNRERIFNLIFKFYLLSQGLQDDTINGFEELIFIHSKKLNPNKDALIIWGQTLLVNYNYHNVLTLTLARKSQRFLPKDKYSMLDGEDLGELLIHQNKSYYFERKRDARRANSIVFMRFDSRDESFHKFKRTQLYYYQSLVTKLENFLGECDIAFSPLHFQADHYLENPFIKNIEVVQSLEIINNTGFDLTNTDKQFLQNFLKHQGIDVLTFYHEGKSISNYQKVDIEGEDDACWEITEVVPWSDVVLNKEKNYLVFNRQIDEEVGSMAYQREDGLWSPTSDINGKTEVDFYSQLKGRFNYIDTGEFFSTQGINLEKFIAIKDSDDKKLESSISVLVYNHVKKKIDKDILHQDTSALTNGQFLETDDSITAYISGQEDIDQLNRFYEKHNVKITPEFQKIFIELGIKNWIRESIENPNSGLPILPQSFHEKHFFTIYVRSPRNQEPKTIAVEFVYQDGFIYIKDILRNTHQVMKRFPFLKTLKNKPDILKNDQEYFVDETDQIFINCYTDDFFTPTLIGRPNILQDLADGTLEVNRQTKDENSSRLLPLVSYYSGDIMPVNRIQNMICFDLKNQTFIQYYVPSGKGLDRTIKRGFRVYHLIGKTYTKQEIPTTDLIEHPITALHFNTLTQNILKISENSQSSLLQKVAKVLVEN